MVLVPTLTAPIFLAIVVFLVVEKGGDHGRSDRVRVQDAIIGMALAALPLKSCRCLLTGFDPSWITILRYCFVSKKTSV